MCLFPGEKTTPLTYSFPPYSRWQLKTCNPCSVVPEEFLRGVFFADITTGEGKKIVEISPKPSQNF